MISTSRSARLGAGILLAAAAVLVGGVSPAGAAQSEKVQLVVYDTFPAGGGIEFNVVPEYPVVPAGNYKVGLANNSVAPHVLVVVSGLPAGTTEAQFLAIVTAVEIGGAPPPAGVSVVGAVFSKPGHDSQKQLDLTQTGTYGFFCPIGPPGGPLHFQEGFIGVFDVV